MPTVTGPIAAVAVGDSSRDYPFFASIVDLESRGWVEEEFFIEGTANRYTIQGQSTGIVRDLGHPYKTRIVVRRPAAASAFNGTVIVEWNNVTAGRDLDIEGNLKAGYILKADADETIASAGRASIGTR